MSELDSPWEPLFYLLKILVGVAAIGVFLIVCMFMGMWANAALERFDCYEHRGLPSELKYCSPSRVPPEAGQP